MGRRHFERLISSRVIVVDVGGGRRTDPSMVRISTINQGKRCPLLRLVKRRLRKDWIYDDFPIIYSEEELKGEVVKGEEMYYERGRVRDILPSSILVTAVFGVYVAYYTINFLKEQKNLLSPLFQ